MCAEVTWEPTASLVQRIHPRLLDLIRRRDRDVLADALEEAAVQQLALEAAGDWMTEEFCDIAKAAKENQTSNDAYPIEEYQSKKSHYIIFFLLNNRITFSDFLLQLFASYHEFHGEHEIRNTHKFALLGNMLSRTERTELFVDMFRSNEMSTVV